MKKIKPFIYFILISLMTGALAAFLTKDSMDIYKDIIKPPLSPPAAAFPIVWSALYILMGAGAAIVYSSESIYKGTAILAYTMQLSANFLWSIIFFNLRAYKAAFLWILVLLMTIAVMIYFFNKISNTAAYLQIPYFIWVIFAAYLTFAIAVLN